jgi:hypothetical protein
MPFDFTTVYPRSLGNITNSGSSANFSGGGFSAMCTVREDHRDELVITEHPVEEGAHITDHAYKKPSEVTLELGWDGRAGDPRQFYDLLLRLQTSRKPFDIGTGKRLYTNMLVASVVESTDQRTETSLLATINCRQIILVGTQTATMGSENNQADPASTSLPTNNGTVSLKPGGGANVGGGNGPLGNVELSGQATAGSTSDAVSVDQHGFSLSGGVTNSNGGGSVTSEQSALMLDGTQAAGRATASGLAVPGNSGSAFLDVGQVDIVLPDVVVH